MDALEAIFTRRSTRAFRPEMPPRDSIETVIRAGRFAPSGHNNQTTHFIVICDPEILRELAKRVCEAFAAMEVTPDTYVSMRHSIEASRKGDYTFHYNAPVLIVTANKKGYGNAIADSACALENMMIAANHLDLGACWINQLHWLDENAGIRAYMERLGLATDETMTGGLAIGFARDGMPNRTETERKGNPVTWVEAQ